MNCEFLNPIDLGNGTTSDWEFSALNCSTTEELIVNEEYPERNFYIDKVLSYGDSLIIFLLVLVFIYTIGEKIFNWFWSK